MPRRRITVNRWALFLFIIAIVVALLKPVGAELLREGPDTRGKASEIAGITSLFVAVIALVVQVRSWLWPINARNVAAYVENESTENVLVDRVRRLNEQEEDHRRIHDPRPLPVRWHAVSADAVDHWANIHGNIGDKRGEELPLDGQFSAIRDTYRRIPSGRMVILGEPGAGKTVLAHHLIRLLLDDPDPVAPIPVLFSLNTWNPRESTLRNWLTTQLLRDHPHLNARAPNGGTPAAQLVNRGRILPVLDGFDEIVGQLHAEAVEEISRFDGPLIITSRRGEYARAADQSRAVGKAAAIELESPALGEVRRYLVASSGKRQADEWDGVFGQLHAEPETPASRNVIAVLSSPLMIMLARTAYRSTDRGSPRELLSIGRSRIGLEEHLLDAYLSTVYDPRRRPDGPGGPRPAWTSVQAHRWLRFLAHHLTRLETHDLAWWQLNATLGRHTRCSTITGAVAIAAVLIFGLVLGLAENLTGGITGFYAGGFTDWLVVWLVLGFLCGLISGLANEAKFGTNRSRWTPEQFRLRWRRTTEAKSARLLASRLTSSFTSWLVIGPVVSFGLVLLAGLVFGPPDEIAGGLMTVFMVGLVIGLAGGLSNAAVAVFGDTHDLNEVINPWSLLRTDRTVTMTRALVFGIVFALVVGLAEKLMIGQVSPLMFRLVVGMLLMSGRLLYSAWGNWLVGARCWLPLTLRLPWRPKLFLEDAYDRGVLRQAGAVYQFRHAQLRDHLAGRYLGERPRHRRDAPDGVP